MTRSRPPCPARFSRTLAALGLVILLAGLVPGAVGTTVAAPGRFSWAALDRTLASHAPASNFLLAEFRGGGCGTVHQRDADTQLAVASTFKLYVLGELARQVQAGIVSWDDEVTLEDELRSMPSGDYAFEPSGTRVRVRDLAAAMIQRSDNTATDHLISLLGRDNVQRAFLAFGHADPAANTPLLLTRELFAIKMTKPASWITTFAAASDERQLEMLHSDIDPLSIDPTGGWGRWNGPTAIDGVEWFASANDLCRVMSGLWSLGSQPNLRPVRDILTGARGGVEYQETLPEVGYKGGYESGVVNMTFVVTRRDGRVFLVTAGYNDPLGKVSTGPARDDLEPVFSCLAALSSTGCATPPIP